MESVYLETSFISYLVARPSRDLIVAAHQQITQDWWVNQRGEFDCYISQVVIDEASAGDPNEASNRVAAISNMPVLEATKEAETLTETIISSGIMPPRAVRDAAHIAVAAVHKIDYILTWNCKHLANAQIIRKLSQVLTDLGRKMPQICTPEELMGE